MRILFTAVPALGHVIPLLPLARAAREAGHEVALQSHPSMGVAAPSVPLLPAGPSMAETLEDIVRRTGGDPLDDMMGFAVEFFVETRLNVGAEAALATAQGFRPDLIVAEMSDYLGQFAAAALGVPWAAHGATLPLIEPLAAQFGQRAITKYAEHGVAPSAAFGYVDPWPDRLIRPGDRYPAERIPVRPEPHQGEGSDWIQPSFPGRADRPTVLVTLGTVVDDPRILARIVTAVSALDVNVVVTTSSRDDLDLTQCDPARVHVVDGFVPLRDLLSSADLVVSAAGAGTVLSTLSVGLPMVLLPLGLDKPMNAERAAAVGTAYVVNDPDEMGGAVEKVLNDRTFRAAALRMAEEIRGMNTPERVLEILVTTSAGR
jgi:UDP:flavonoid glycosyltransferase YjiC (YdhE family)